MLTFDIRVTGEIDGELHDADATDKVRDLASTVVAELVAHGAKFHSVMVNNRPTYVTIDRVEVKSKEPDLWVSNMLREADKLVKSDPVPSMPADKDDGTP